LRERKREREKGKERETKKRGNEGATFGERDGYTNENLTRLNMPKNEESKFEKGGGVKSLFSKAISR